MDKNLFCLKVLAILPILAFCRACCPCLVPNEAPLIMPLPALAMAQDQNCIYNLAPYGSDDTDFGANLTWSATVCEPAIVAAVIDQPNQLLAIFSQQATGITAIEMTLADSLGAVSETEIITVEVRSLFHHPGEGEGEIGEGEGEQPVETYAVSATVRPPEAGLVIMTPAANSYAYGDMPEAYCQTAQGWQFERWEGPVSDALANPTMATIVTDVNLVAVCSSLDSGEGEGEVIPDCDIDCPDNFFTVMIILADSGNDGELSWEEIKARYSKLEDKYMPIVMSSDKDGNGQLSRAEFVNGSLPTFLILLKGYPDANGDNVITYQEAVNLVDDLEPQDFQLMDTNANGVIDCADF